MSTLADAAREPAAQPRPPNRRLGAALVIGSIVLVGIDLIGAWNPWGLLWVDRLFHHPFLFGVPVALAGSFGLAMLLRHPALGVLLQVSGAVVACVWALYGWWCTSLVGTTVSDVIEAPEGRGPSYELVVRQSTDGIIDPAWLLSIRTTGTPWAREVEFGCMSGDAAANAYKSARWESREQLVVKSGEGKAISVGVDPGTGKPHVVNQHAWTCSGWD